jgi:DNA polymerase-3 subunit chi
VAVRAGAPEALPALDLALWRGAPDAFLPHGLAGGPHDALQPVLLGASREAENGARCAILLAGARTDADEVAALERVCIVFDGSGASVEAARAQWRSLTSAGASAQYWSQDDGPWHKKAESG